MFGDFVAFDFDFVDFDFDFVDFKFVDFAFDAALAQALTNEIVFSGVFCFLRLLWLPFRLAGFFLTSACVGDEETHQQVA